MAILTTVKYLALNRDEHHQHQSIAVITPKRKYSEV
jgi:hypothetical protein